MRKLTVLLMVLGLALLAVPMAQADFMTFSNVDLSTINVIGTGTALAPTGHITFTPAAGVNFQIRTSTFGTAVGDNCTLVPASATGFAFGPPIGAEAGGTAAVTGTATLTITDHAAVPLTATVTFPKLEANAAGSIDNLNDQLALNITGISYAGAETDLLAMLHDPLDVMFMSFAVNPSALLAAQGTAGYSLSTSYSGTIVPVPPAVWLFGSGLLGLVGLRRKLKA